MANPSAYSQSYNFSGYQAVNPSTPLPAAQIDIQLAAIETSTEELRNAIIDVRRSDGALANNSVGPDQLSAALSLGFTLRGAWAQDTAYSAGDGVVYDETFYAAREAHTSEAGAEPDINPTQWNFLFTFSAIATPDGSITPAKLADDEEAGFQAKLGLGTLALENVAYLDSRIHALSEKAEPAADDEVLLLDSEASFAGKKITWSDLLAAVAAELGSPRDLGEYIELSGATLPAGCVWADGAAISRTTYAAYFALVGTTYGAGNGTTTFNVPDRRGRVGAGKDNMGGTSANRLTGLSGGLDGDVLGAVGGLETHTLTTAQLAVHAHGSGTYEAESHNHNISTRDDADLPSGDYVGNNNGSNSGSRTLSTGNSGALDVSGTSSNAGSGAAHNNVQPTIICNVAIYVGV